MPVKLSGITVRVLNGTDRSGLAAGIADKLKSQGIKVTMIGNSVGDEYRGTVKIMTGVPGLLNAYTAAVFFDDYELILDARRNDTVDLILGEDFEKLADPAKSKEALGRPLAKPRSCLPLNN